MRGFLSKVGHPETDFSVVFRALLTSVKQNFQEFAMENQREGAVGATVVADHRAESLAETRKEWLAPELRKVEIAEVTAASSGVIMDGSHSS